MGKITKRKEGRAVEVEFEGGKTVSIRTEGREMFLIEIGFLEAEIRTVATKDIRLYDDVLRILETSKTLEEASVHLDNLYLSGQRRTTHEKDVAEHEELSVALAHYTIRRVPLQKWEQFQQLVQKFYGEKTKYTLDPNHAKEPVLEALEAYVDPQHPDHRKVVDFLLSVPVQDPLRHKEDGLWILRDMMARVAAFTAQPAECYREFRNAIRGLKLSLSNRYYDPLPYLNDVDGALDWLHAAETSMGRKDWDAALGFCWKAMDAAPNYLEVYYKAAECYILKRDYDSALGALDSVRHMPMAEKVFKYRTDYYMLYLGLCLKMPEKNKALPHLEKLKMIAEKYGVDVPGLTSGKSAP